MSGDEQVREWRRGGEGAAVKECEDRNEESKSKIK